MKLPNKGEKEFMRQVGFPPRKKADVHLRFILFFARNNDESNEVKSTVAVYHVLLGLQK